MSTTTINGVKISTATDERNQHAVLVALVGGEPRVYARSSSAHSADAIDATLRRDIARHGFGAIEGCFDVLPVAQYRTTKAGRRVLCAA
jgi:hypothetical protein